MSRGCSTCRGERSRTMDIDTATSILVDDFVACPDCGREVEATPLLKRFAEAASFEPWATPAKPALPPPPRDPELDDGLHEAIALWQRRALIAERALLDVLDGTKVHELHGMTGLDDTRCHQIYNVWHKIAYPDKPYPYPETGVGEPEETT
jgi:hypothetical protein